MLEWADDLKISGTELFLDSRRARSLCFVSHAHSDHLGEHATAIATPATAALAERRIELGSVRALAYGADLCDACGGDDAAMRVRLLPAGHVLGSAMLHVTRAGGTLLYTGDFKLRHSLTVEPAAPEPADVLVMECTYGQPMFRFPPWRTVADELVERATTALRDGRQPIVMGYSLGKAQ